jgi:hypothetical protein
VRKIVFEHLAAYIDRYPPNLGSNNMTSIVTFFACLVTSKDKSLQSLPKIGYIQGLRLRSLVVPHGNS